VAHEPALPYAFALKEPLMQVTMVKKRLANGSDCQKCGQAERMLKERDLWSRVSRVVWAIEGDDSSEGVLLAARHGVETAPFFIVTSDSGEERIVESTLALMRMMGPAQAAASGPSISTDEVAARDPLDAQGLIRLALERMGTACPIAFSGAEDVVLIDMAARTGLSYSVFCLDTGRLHPETYQFIERVRSHYGVEIALTAPNTIAVEALVRKKGLFSFYRDGHGECCSIRKIEPLRRLLAEQRGWITGQRKDQSPNTRAAVPLVETDGAFSGQGDSALTKLNPLSNWTSAKVWSYIREHEVPYNKLHERGFISIGCEPCTRAILPGQHEREGRWWWEEATKKECGLHVAKS
jgi:phosphoadenosine phosphosulfate reductase